MSRVFFTADTHFSHDKVAWHRGFDSAAEHDEALIDAWNSVVNPKDIVWHLGDVGMGTPGRWRSQVERLAGTIHLVSGNHDESHPMHRSAPRRQSAYLDAFASVASSARRRIRGHEVLLSHYPYSGDHVGHDRHRQFRLRDLGVPILHGHTHTNVAFSHSEERGTAQTHVGWDTWHTPLSEEMLIDFVMPLW